MAADFTAGLAGLSLLTGSNQFAGLAPAASAENRAVRRAKAQFIAEPSAPPPWRQPAPKRSLTQQVAAALALPFLVQRPPATLRGAARDEQTSVAAYRTLEHMRVLAEMAAAPATSSTERKRLDKVFQQGLADLRTFLAEAPRDRLALAFGKSSRRADSAGMAVVQPGVRLGATLAPARNAPLPALTGMEQFRLDLERPGASDTILVDLATGPQPPTIDSVVAAMNAAIAAVPRRDANGDPVLDAAGAVVPKWSARFSADKGTDGWRLKLEMPNDAERLSIQQEGAADALQVITSLGPADARQGASVFRFDDAEGSFLRHNGGSITSIDRMATARAQLLAKPGATAAPVNAGLQVQAITSDGNGGTFVVGTATGDLAGEHGGNGEDLFLARLDDRGEIVWQRSLGAAGAASGAAITLAPNGDILLAGRVSGVLDGTTSDGDMLVSRYTASGDEVFATALRRQGVGEATSIAVGADGAIYVGGSEDGGATIARLGAAGTLLERQALAGATGIRAMAIGADGGLLLIARGSSQNRLLDLDAQDLGTVRASFDLGTADARSIAVAGDGRIAIAGATRSDIAGTQVGSRSDGHDAFVTLLSADFASARTSYIGSPGDDGADSVTFVGDSLFVGGRTRGELSSPRRGLVDAFVARVDLATGATAGLRQFGTPMATAAPVLVAGSPGGSTALAGLGLVRGVQNPVTSDRLMANTTLRPGDTFSVRVGDGRLHRITIAADDTLASLARRIGETIGDRKLVSAARSGDRRVLRFEASPARAITLVAGPEGSDALAKLGLSPARLVAPPAYDPRAPRVQPGGSFGLDLVEGMSLTDSEAASASLAQIKSAISTTQVAWRSLWWDDTKARMVGGGPPALTAEQQSQMAGYREALGRLSALVQSNAAATQAANTNPTGRR